MNQDLNSIIEDNSLLLVRKKDQLFSIVDNEVIMLNIKREEYYYLDKVGSKLWQYLENPISFKELTNYVEDCYNVENSEYVSEIFEFIDELFNLNLIEIFQDK